jgi:hypothetical protein
MRKPLPLLCLTPAQDSGSCGIIALAAFTGLSYGDVLEAASKICKHPQHRGMYCTELLKAAGLLGFKMRMKAHCNFKRDEGILNMSAKKKKGKKSEAGHFVVVAAGLIFDGLEVWEPKDYFADTGYTPHSIMIINE